MQGTPVSGSEATNTAGTAPAAEQPETTAHLEDEQSAVEMDFGAILEQFEQESAQYSPGQVVQGKVIGVSDTGVVIDFGYKSEGVANIAEFTTPDGEVTVKRDDEVEVVIKNMNGGDGSPVLSYADAQRRKSWDVLEEAFNKEETVKGRVLDRIKGGVKVDLNGVEAFLPASQIDSRPVGNLDEYIGQDIETKIIKFSRRKGNVVLSRKVIVDEVLGAQKKETLGQLEEGYIVEGKVKSLTDYGAFVDLGGLDGLLHVTDMSWGKVQKPADLLKAGEQVQVKVLKLDREHEKISLGLKQLTADPWTSVEERYPVGTNIKGKVSSLADYGAFIELEPGVEGLIHISEMSWSKRSKHPNKILNMGEEVEVRILDINPTDRRISLSLKQLMTNPWDSLRERYQVGTKVTGKVRNLTDFGAFVEIEDGVDGLVHVSDISWSKRIKHPKDALKKGQEVEAVVTNIDTVGQRLSLSIKDLTPSTWDTFVQQHKPGDVVKGKISRFASFGVFVELGEDLEGLCHISELSDEKVDKPEEVVQIGQEMDFKILRIDAEAGKIGLSARAVGKEDEPEFDAKSYSTEAKGGMASLAELANLQFSNSEEDDKK
ncbi:MAG TPA: 30S ribosomal protein S1 [Pyrinomonadaceae bacterium]|nr:30S ribosomal protein S1 [Pyrinomonadaceae bacterium]